jgi:hypothetical protein
MVTICTTSTNPSTTNSRPGIITVTAGEITRTIIIIQDPSPDLPYLNVNPTIINLGYESGSSENFSITSNVEWTIDVDADWLTVNPLSGFDEGTIMVIANSENPSTSNSRTATITVSGTEGVSPQTITVIQAPQCYFSVEPIGITLNYESGSFASFTISSNSGWSISNNASWISVSPTSGSGDAIITVTSSSANPSTTTSRSATVTVTGCSGSVTITLTQEPSPDTPYLTVNLTSLTLDADQVSNSEIVISSNISWNVTDNADWLTVSPTSGTGDANLQITATENTTIENRIATISISGSDITREVNITQEAIESFIRIIKPNGGETWEVGKTYPIEWESMNVSEVNILFSLNNGTNWTPIIEGYSSTGTYNWTIPDTESNQCKVKIISSSNSFIYDISDDVFIFGPNGIEINTFENLTLKIFPNPTFDVIYIQPSEDVEKEVIIKLFNTAGKEVYLKKLERLESNQTYQIDMGGLNYGVYYLQISDSKLVKIEKVIKH